MMNRDRKPLSKDEFLYTAETKARTRRKKTASPSILQALTEFVLIVSFVIASVYGLLFLWRVSSPKEVAIPELVGLDEAAAAVLLGNSKLQFDVTSRKPSDEFDEGKVISAIPEAGRRVKQGRKISLVVSMGSRWTNVPNVKEMSERRALVRLTEKQLNVGRVRYIYYARLPKGFVIDQLPTPATRVSKDSQVNIIVSQGPRENASGSGSTDGTEGQSSGQEADDATNEHNDEMPSRDDATID